VGVAIRAWAGTYHDVLEGDEEAECARKCECEESSSLRLRILFYRGAKLKRHAIFPRKITLLTGKLRAVRREIPEIEEVSSGER
jgi:hypothetical protein